jgi:hypothetical protein
VNKSPRASISIDILTDADFGQLMQSDNGLRAFGVFVALVVAGRERLQRGKASRLSGTDTLVMHDDIGHIVWLTHISQARIEAAIRTMAEVASRSGDQPWASVDASGRLNIKSFFKFNANDKWGGPRPGAGRRNQDDDTRNQDEIKLNSSWNQVDSAAFASASPSASALASASPSPPSGGGGGVGVETSDAPKVRIKIPDSWAMAGAEGPIAALADLYNPAWVQAAVNQAATKQVRGQPADLVGGILRRYAQQGGPDPAPTLRIAGQPPAVSPDETARLEAEAEVRREKRAAMIEAQLAAQARRKAGVA